MKTKKILLIAILAAIISVSGFFKIPSLIPGSEFQMSAPIAVIIAMLFGFKVYLTAGILSSIISLSIGSATFYSVIIAMTFRIVVGLFIYIFGVNRISLIFAGPLGTIIARIVLSSILKVDAKALLVAAIPGMIFTIIVSSILYKPIYKIVKNTEFKDYLFLNKLLEV